MDKRQIMTYVAAIVTTLAETGGGPESSLYLALGGDINKWNDIKGLLVSSGLIVVRSDHWVEITAKGRKLAVDIEAARTAA